MRIVLSEELESDFAKVKLREGEYWHGGTFGGGQVKGVLYCTKNLRMALSYVDMCRGRFGKGKLQLIRARLTRPAPNIEIVQLEKQFGIDNEEWYTPASVFDGNLHDEAAVYNMVRELRKRGYDHAVLTDIAFGVREEDDAIIIFDGVHVQLLASYAAEGFADIDRLDGVS